jgi:peptidoglycan-associated lipoprotein
MSKWWMTVVLGAGLVAATGCSSAPKTQAKSIAPPIAAAARPQLTTQQQQAVDQAENETGAMGLSIDEAILKLCPSVSPPRFDYDSSKVKDSYRTAMAGLAECMISGGLKDKEVLLVGHADPRGEEDYNMSLGGKRAQAVRKALESLGVQEKRVDLSSRGALDATGTEETSWAKDRRVDIKLKM